MKFIGTLSYSQTREGEHRVVAGRVPKRGLTELRVKDMLPSNYFSDIAYNDDQVELKARAVQHFARVHKFLTGVLAINKEFSIWVLTSDMFGEAATVRRAAMVYYIFTPDSLGSIGEVSVSKRDGKYHVVSPYIRNNRYNGGRDHYCKKSMNLDKSLASVRRYIRPTRMSELHLPEITEVIYEQREAIDNRRNRSRALMNDLNRYPDELTEELVSLRKHIIAGVPYAYEFKDDSLAATIDKFIEEDAEAGEAIDKAVEESLCYQRVHIRQNSKHAKISYLLTHIELSKRMGGDHSVYGEHQYGEYLPIADMPKEVAEQISTLDFLGGEHRTKQWDACVWVLNTGMMVEKGVLYYLPVAPLRGEALAHSKM